MRRINKEKQNIREVNRRRRELVLDDIGKQSKFHLFVNWFENTERQDELDYCQELNMTNAYIDQITYLEGRPDFNEFFQQFDENAINIIANTDIYLDETIRYAENIKSNEVYCITRKELVSGKIKKFEERNPGCKPRHSQDVWIFRGKPKQLIEAIYLGIPGCDNKIAHHLSLFYKLRNPYYYINAVHVHKETKRNYNPHNGVEKYRAPYKFVDP